MIINSEATTEFHYNGSRATFHHVGFGKVHPFVVFEIVPCSFKVYYLLLKIKLLYQRHSKMVVEFPKIYAFVIEIKSSFVAHINQNL